MTETAPETTNAPSRRQNRGGGLSKRKAGLPVWAWVVGGAVVVGVGYFYLRGRKAAAASTTAGDGTSTAGPPSEPTTILPVDQGLSQSQYDALRAQISDLQGEVSKEEKTETAAAKAESEELQDIQQAETAEDKRKPKPRRPPQRRKPPPTRGHAPGGSTGGGGSGGRA